MRNAQNNDVQVSKCRKINNKFFALFLFYLNETDANLFVYFFIATFIVCNEMLFHSIECNNYDNGITKIDTKTQIFLQTATQLTVIDKSYSGSQDPI